MPHSPNAVPTVRRNTTEVFDFKHYFARLLPRRRLAGLMAHHAPHCRRARKLPHYEMIMALVEHTIQGIGTLAEHVEQLLGVQITDEALVDRRQRLPWVLWERMLALCLRPQADPQQHPDAFYKGFRLVGLDGSLFSVRNTPWILQRLHKAATRRAKAAFAKLRLCVLVELRLHNPLAAMIGTEGDSELSQGRRLLAQLPPQCLLLIDRLYGVPSFLCDFLQHCLARQSEFLVRMRKGIKARLLQRLPDGSRLLEVRVRDAQGAWQTLQVRQIVGWVQKPGRGRRRIELWTSLLLWREFPAAELLELYATRWEQELAFKELKIDLRGGELLASHTPHTAQQEAAALLLAQAVLVQQRIATGTLAAVPVLRVSFVKVLAFTRGLAMFTAASQGIITEAQLRQVIRAAMERLGRCVSAPRRSRNQPRAVRQPIHAWPRKLRNQSHEGKVTYHVVGLAK